MCALIHRFGDEPLHKLLELIGEAGRIDLLLSVRHFAANPMATECRHRPARMDSALISASDSISSTTAYARSIDCPNCHKNTTTYVRPVWGLLAWLLCVVVAILCVYFFLRWLCPRRVSPFRRRRRNLNFITVGPAEEPPSNPTDNDSADTLPAARDLYAWLHVTRSDDFPAVLALYRWKPKWQPMLDSLTKTFLEAYIGVNFIVLCTFPFVYDAYFCVIGLSWSCAIFIFFVDSWANTSASDRSKEEAGRKLI